MWLTDLMEIQFAAAMLCMLVDLGGRRFGGWRPYVVGGVAAAAIAVSILDLLANWSQVTGTGLALSPVQSPLASLYVVDRLGTLVILTILIVSLAASVYSMAAIDRKENAGPFFALLMLITTSAIGVVSAGDFVTLFLFWEVMSVSAYGLVSFRRGELSLEAAMKYLFLAGSGSLIYLFGVALVYSLDGSILLSALPALFEQGGQLGLFAVLLVILGLGVEAAIFPMHTWLPDAYGAAPVPSSAFLGGALTGTAVFALLKVLGPLTTVVWVRVPVTVQGLQWTLVALSVLTMLVGNLGALGQTNLRRLLGFSSVSQVGYMLAALSTLSPLGLVAVTFQIWNHGLVKSNFFMLTGASGSDYSDAEMSKLKGAGQQSRSLGLMVSASSLAMVGSPPFGMFWSELLIVQSLLAAGGGVYTGLAVVVVLNILLSIVYYFRVVNNVAMSPVEGTARPSSGASWIPAVFLLGLSLATGILPLIVLGTIV